MLEDFSTNYVLNEKLEHFDGAEEDYQEVKDSFALVYQTLFSLSKGGTGVASDLLDSLEAFREGRMEKAKPAPL